MWRQCTCMVYLSQRPQVMKFDPAPVIIMATPLIRPNFFYSLVTVSTGFHCTVYINSSKIHTKTCNAHIDGQWISVWASTLVQVYFLFHFTYQDEYTVVMVHTVFLPFRSIHGADEENLRPFFLSDHVLLFLGPLCLINLSDVLQPFKSSCL